MQPQPQAQAQPNTRASLRPERQQQIPAQPRLDLTFDQLDLSKNSLTRQSDTELEESIISDESISLDLKQPKLKEPVTQPRQTTSPGSESKEFLKPAKVPKRRSLDLKYQEINLSNDDQRKHRKNKTSFSRTSVRRSVEMERMKHDSNSTSNSNARDETKETKRRSFFGVFK